MLTFKAGQHDQITFASLRDPKLRYEFDLIDEGQNDCFRAFKQHMQAEESLDLCHRQSKVCPCLIENDYDSDSEVVKKAKSKAIRELKAGIFDFLEGRN